MRLGVLDANGIIEQLIEASDAETAWMNVPVGKTAVELLAGERIGEGPSAPLD